MGAPVHHAPTPVNWLVYYGQGVFDGDPTLGTTLAASIFASLPAGGSAGGSAIASTSKNVAAVRAVPYAEGWAVDTSADPYPYVISVDSAGNRLQNFGPLIAVVKDKISARDALSDQEAAAAYRQFALESLVFGNWVETIRPKLPGEDDSGTATAPDGTKYKSYVIDLTDPRYAMGKDHHWQNGNHPGEDLGWISAPSSEPKHGVAGVISGVANILESAFKDCVHNPLGAALALLVVVSAAPLGPFLLPALEVTTVAAAGAQVTGLDKDALAQEGSALKTVATHPAEVGEAIAGAELIVAGAAVGAKGLQGFGTKLLTGGLLGTLDGVGGPSLPGVPTDPGSSSSAAGAAGAQGAAGPAWWGWFGRSSR